MTAAVRSAGVRSFPVDVLEKYLGSRSAGDTADLLGVSVRSLHRWRRTGLTERQADVLAIRAGSHPGELWSDWWYDEVDP